MYEVYSSDAFESEYTYHGMDLGVTWTARETFFRLWAPTAEEIQICLYRSGDPDTDDLVRKFPMIKDVNGTWIARESGDLNGLYYTYLVMVDGRMNECCDPYAKAVGVNGQRAMILDFSATNPDGWDQDTDPHGGSPITDAVIYELHIRDLSMHRSSHIQRKGTFLGLTETGTKTNDGHPTGLDHIRSLGVTHVQLLPVFDFGFTDEARRKPQFNWGYDPVNFNVPEGSYASSPLHGGIRVREMKQMVKTLHDHGISVIMDVVYNHVYGREHFCFNQVVPGYFSRIDESGVYSNGSFCGNDTASERAMVRKYIVDSVLYWAEEYHIDGFRFDLVGLIDVDTFHEIIRTVHASRPGVLFYGEGWQMKTALTKPGLSLCTHDNSPLVPGLSFFSDTFRDLMRGTVFDDHAPGYAVGAVCPKEELEACFMGLPAWASQPYQCVNYVSCHDNHTLFDRICLTAPDAPREIQIQMNCLAAAFTLLSQGVPFFQAGEEILRTKPGKHGGFDGNSYRSPDRINAIQWDTLDQEEYQQVLSYYKGLIAFRKAHPGLRLQTREEVCRQVHPVSCENPHCVAFQVDEPDRELFVIFNADTASLSIPLPEGAWDIHIQGEKAGVSSLGSVEQNATVFPFSTTVLVRKKPVEVVAALIWEKDKFLICQRPEGKARGLLWEFVGGKVEPGETLSQALSRECAEELAIVVDVGSEFMQVTHQYPDLLIRLTLLHCTIASGIPQMLEHADMKWIHPSQIDDFPFCPADKDILQEIKRQYQNRAPLQPYVFPNRGHPKKG